MKRRTLFPWPPPAHSPPPCPRSAARVEAAEDPGARRHALHRPAHDGAGAGSAGTRSRSSIAARPRPIVTPKSSASRATATARSTGSRIASGTWSSTTPATCRATCVCRPELLAPKVRQYVFTSSISVYPNFSVPRDEKSPVGKLRRRDRREGRRRNLRPAEGAVRAGGARRRCPAAPPSFVRA